MGVLFGVRVKRGLRFGDVRVDIHVGNALFVLDVGDVVYCVFWCYVMILMLVNYQ